MKFNSDFSESIFKSKYLLEGEKKPEEAVERVVKVIANHYPELKEKAYEYLSKRWFLPGGGIWRAAGNPTKKVSFINCTTLFQVKDSLESIFDSLYWWAKFSAYGQGEGIDISKLRPRGSKLHNTARTSTGAVSFMHLYDSVLNVISQQGRRGASLISISDKHPDLEEFCKIKAKEGVMESANISVQISDEFMQAVLEDKKWQLEYIGEYETIKREEKAKKLFNLISEQAWKTGDPGVQFSTRMHEESNSDYLGVPVVSSNACSEQILDPHNTCVLSSINLAKFHEFETNYIDLIKFSIYALDSFVKTELEEGRSPSEVQRKKMVDIPRIGLGVTGLADYFIRNKIEYGSEASIEASRKIFGTLAGETYKASYEIAKKAKKSFTAYDEKKYMKAPIVKRLLEQGLIEERHLAYQAHVCKTTVAPNGTLSIVAECGGSGIEPIFSRFTVRRERATTNNWKEWFIFNAAVENYLRENKIEVTKENALKHCSEKHWTTAHSINNENKIKLMSVIQSYIDSAISVTYNLPKTATVEDVKNIYISAWKNKLKAVTVFREGCKPGILITEENYNESLREKVLSNRFSPIRPDVVECDIHEITFNKEKFIVLVGIVEEKPYEIFITKNSNNKIDLERHKKGFIKKLKKGAYDLIIENGAEKTILEDISKVFNGTYGTLARFISMSLRHNVPIPFIVDQLTKSDEFTSFEKVVSRILKKYIDEGVKVVTSDSCPNCKSNNLIYQGGCKLCQECGYSRCD